MPKARKGWMGISGCIMLNVWRRQRSTGGRRDGPVLESSEVHFHPICNAERVFDGAALEPSDAQVYLSSVAEWVLNGTRGSGWIPRTLSLPQLVKTERVAYADEPCRSGMRQAEPKVEIDLM